MYAPTIDHGLASFAPRGLVTNSELPPVVLTGFELHGESVTVGSSSGVLPMAANLVDEFDLGADQNTFTFEFAALGYESPERNRFRYRLEGFDDDWSETTADRRFATYTNVPPGEYTFWVQASNSADVWTPIGYAATVRVAAPWYAAPWVRGLATVAVIALVAATFRWRTRRHRQRTRELQRRLDERARHQQERELLLAAAQEQSERLHSILAAAPVGVVLLDADMGVVVENKLAAAELASLSAFTATGQLERFAGLSMERLLGADRMGMWSTATVGPGVRCAPGVRGAR